jgi:O-antigen/teichoic acid export membrane protein
MSEEKASYRQIAKSTSLFGGVQVFNILILVVRSKFIAILLGPIGVGVVGLLNSTTSLISAATNFGLGLSAVKDVSMANATNNDIAIGKVITIFRRLVWITGLLGSIVTLLFSSILSRATFGNGNFTFAFAYLSITLLFNQLTSGQNVLLQGMRKLKNLAKANMIGAFSGLLISIPLYYFLGIRGIVPAIVFTSASALVISWFFARKIPVQKVFVSAASTIKEGKNMLQMGFMVSISGLINIGASYIVRVFISNHGSVKDVGLYTAGFAIISTYVGLVFTSMGTDYYPRLSALAIDNKKSTQLINQQAEVALLVLGPILSIFLIFVNWIVILLYSTKFVSVDGMIHYASLGMYFKAVSWAIAYIFLAKGASKIFFWSELAANIYLLVFNLIFYYFLGLTGMGISFLIGYIIYFVQVLFIAKIKYSFYIGRDLMKIFVIQVLIGVLCFFCIKFILKPWAYICGAIFIGISIKYSYVELNKRLNLLQLLPKLLLRK